MKSEQVRAVQAKRFAYFLFVYEQWQKVQAGRIQSLPATPVREHLGIDNQEGERIEEYLKGHGLLKYVTMGPSVQITPYGIRAGGQFPNSAGHGSQSPDCRVEWRISGTTCVDHL